MATTAFAQDTLMHTYVAKKGPSGNPSSVPIEELVVYLRTNDVITWNLKFTCSMDEFVNVAAELWHVSPTREVVAQILADSKPVEYDPDVHGPLILWNTGVNKVTKKLERVPNHIPKGYIIRIHPVIGPTIKDDCDNPLEPVPRPPVVYTEPEKQLDTQPYKQPEKQIEQEAESEYEIEYYDTTIYVEGDKVKRYFHVTKECGCNVNLIIDIRLLSDASTRVQAQHAATPFFPTYYTQPAYPVAYVGSGYGYGMNYRPQQSSYPLYGGHGNVGSNYNNFYNYNNSNQSTVAQPTPQNFTPSSYANPGRSAPPRPGGYIGCCGGRR